MGIELIHDDDRNYPMIICDVCSQKIEDYKNCNVCFPDPTKPVFVHKPCDRLQPREKQFPWMPLYQFLVFLQHNLRFTPKLHKQEEQNLNEWYPNV